MSSLDRGPAQHRDRKQRSGDDTRRGRWKNQLQRHAPARQAESEARLAQSVRNQPHRALGGADDNGQHEDRERDRSRGSREVVLRHHDERICEQPERDRWGSHQHVACEPDPVGPTARSVLGQVDAAEHADGDRGQRGEGDDDRAAHDRVGDASARDTAGSLRIQKELQVGYRRQALGGGIIGSKGSLRRHEKDYSIR